MNSVPWDSGEGGENAAVRNGVKTRNLTIPNSMLSQFGHSISLIKIKIAFSRRSVELKTFVYLFIYLFIFFAFFRRTIAEGDTLAPPPPRPPAE